MPKLIKYFCSSTIILIMALFVSSHSFGENKCAEMYSRIPVLKGKKEVIKTLKDELGYSSQVATRLANDLPELAEKLINLPKAKSGAIKLYKGIDKSPNEVQLDLSLYQKNEIWFSLDLDTANGFAQVEKNQFGTILELEVPNSFFSTKDPAELIKNGLYDGTINLHDIPNLKPFIKRIGLVSPDNSKTKWVTYEDAVKMGFFKDRFNYKKFFLSR